MRADAGERSEGKMKRVGLLVVLAGEEKSKGSGEDRNGGGAAAAKMRVAAAAPQKLKIKF